MRISNISVGTYGAGNFMAVVGDPETYVHITMTEQESDQIRAIVTEMFLSRQKAIAKEIETAAPLMIELRSETIEPSPPSSSFDDDVPF